MDFIPARARVAPPSRQKGHWRSDLHLPSRTPFGAEDGSEMYLRGLDDPVTVTPRDEAGPRYLEKALLNREFSFLGLRLSAAQEPNRGPTLYETCNERRCPAVRRAGRGISHTTRPRQRRRGTATLDGLPKAARSTST